jgi:hypothetical protein
MERLAALEAEVKADADAQRTRKDAALARLREQREAQAAEAAQAAQAERARSRAEPRRAERDRAAESRRAERDRESRDDDDEGLGGAIELASKANRVKRELQRPRKKGEKSWVISGVASLALGPIGWLYAGSWREAVPATAVTVALASLASWILPVFLMLPVLMVAMPLSAIAGVVYALQYNRKGARQRLFDGEKDSQKRKQLDRG